MGDDKVVILTKKKKTTTGFEGVFLDALYFWHEKRKLFALRYNLLKLTLKR